MLPNVSDLQLSVSSISVSVQDLSEITLTSFEENKNLEETCYNMQPMQEKMWPYSFLERFVKRGYTYYKQNYLQNLEQVFSKIWDLIFIF